MSLTEDEIEKLRCIVHWWDNRRGFNDDTSTIEFDRSNSKVASVRLGGKIYGNRSAGVSGLWFDFVKLELFTLF